MVAALSAGWATVIVVGLGTVMLKAAGPVIAGGRDLPGWARRAVPLLAPAVLAALVATQTFGGERALVIDERALGLAAAAVAVAMRAPVLAVVAASAVVTALARLAA